MASDTPASLFEENETPLGEGSPKFPGPSEFFNSIPSSTGNDPSTSVTAQSASQAQTAPPAKATVDAQGRTLNPRSCVTCRKRKVKCDKVHPCNNCVRQHIECVFPAPGRAPRKARKLGDTGRDKELLERLRRLEGVVKHLGVEVPGDEKSTGDNESVEVRDRIGSGASAGSTPVNTNGQDVAQSKPAYPSAGNEEDFRARTKWLEESSKGRFENRFGRLVINEGKSRYINNSFWANLSNEVEDLKGILNQSDEESDLESPGNAVTTSTSHQEFVLGYSSQNVDLLSLHPMPHQIEVYWQTFKENVDPLVKVLHIPSIEPTVLSAASHLTNLSKGFECLLFAIYYGATTSLTQEGCLERLGESRTLLLSRYRFAFEQALARANFLTTEEIIVLQAFVVFLMCLRRNSDARVIWTLTGLVVRIAQTIGIHRDGLHFGLQPFEVEMRRRLWWQVCILDTRASEDHGCDPTILEQAFDTKMPLNINDVDIEPKSKAFPDERVGCTDMSFCLIRFEVANTFRRINYVPPGPALQCTNQLANISLQDKERWITECHRRLEDRYLKHCDMSVPLFWVTATVARLMMSKMWLMVYHPFQRQDGGASLPEQVKERLFITSLENIEYSILLETEARTMKWGWLFRTYMQWHALAFMLSELCHRTTGDLVERAWVAVEKTRDGRWGEHVTDDSKAGHLWKPLRKLYRKAMDARQRGLQEEQLAKMRESGQVPARHYSPNANPMFGHPKRPQMTRAPLSRAQLIRFSEGPVYGTQPIDSHELMKSPRLDGDDNDDAMDTAGLSTLRQTRSQEEAIHMVQPRPDGHLHATGNPNAYSQQVRLDTHGKPIGGPMFGRNFLQAHEGGTGGIGAIDFNNIQVDPSTAAPFNNAQRSNSMVGITSSNPGATNLAQTQQQLAATTVPGMEPVFRTNSADNARGFDMDATAGNGDLNWESWDQLVRQFGMDIDSMGPNPGDQPASIEVGWAGPANWGNTTLGTGPWPGMGTGGGMAGDWF